MYVRGIASTLGCLTPLIALAAAGVVVRTLSFIETRSWVDLGAIAISLFFTILWLRALVSGIADSFVGRIVPYFERRVGLEGLLPFASGLALARNRRKLDALAASAGIATLSSFLEGWHDAEEGSRVLMRLREEWNGKDAVRTELATIENALAAAHAQGIRFRLVVRPGRDQFISPMEMDRLEGSFW